MQEWSESSSGGRSGGSPLQQAFSSKMQSTLHLAIPVLEALHKTWTSCSKNPKYTFFVPALDAAAEKINKSNIMYT
jgi:hypothetical protein